MPPLEVWEKYQVSNEFMTSTHGAFSCTNCHGGQTGDLTKEEAHTGMVKDPSAGDAPSCKTCHQDIATKHAASLHGTQNGYFTQFAVRTGQSQISPQLQSMFDKHCAGCHTSCGQCHISRPTSVEGGLVNGHVVSRRPSQTDNCTACHGSRVGAEFRGHNPGIPPDAHYLKGMNCFSCHTGTELHGDGMTPAGRYDAPNAPDCADCHPGVLTDTQNPQHSLHVETVACQVCHAVTYKNCYNCHVALDERGLEHPSRMDFRIGRNPAKSDDRPWDYAVVRHIPIAPTSFADWGVSLPSYDAGATWRFATPHNIQKNTPQNASCDACHGVRKLFLTPEYADTLIQEGVMFQEEIQANDGVLVRELP